MFTKINYFCMIIIGLTIVSLPNLSIVSNCIAASDSNLPYKEGEVLVRFAPKANGKLKSTDERNQILSSFNAGTIKHSVKLVPGLSLVKLPEGVKVKDTIQKLKSKNEFLYVEPNWKIKLCSRIPNDESFDELWGLRNTGQTLNGIPGCDIDAPQAWDIITDSNIIVAVIDSGVDYTHPDLAANMWTDANGHHGYDFGDGDNTPMDYYGHGTFCAGIIGAVGNNGEGVTGVCWQAKIMAIKIGTDYGAPDTMAAIRGIDYAVEMGAKVLNNSWSVPYSLSLKDSIEAANSAGVLFIAAAGNEDSNNDSRMVYPANYDCNNVISVMATDPCDERMEILINNVTFSWGSNYGEHTVDLGAPGKYIFGCAPGNNYDLYEGGTSAAAPYVAGACALVWAAYPELTHLQVKEAIMNSVDIIPDLNGLCVTGGRLNLYKALRYWTPATAVTLSDTDDVEEGDRRRRGDYITYTISYDANGFKDSNVVLMDNLSEYVDFVSADGNYVYDPNLNTVTWNLGSFTYESNDIFTLVVGVKSTAPQGQYITNIAELTGDNFTIEANEQTYIIDVSLSNSDDIEGCVLPSSETGESLITYTISYNVNDFSDTNVKLTDYLPIAVDFNYASGDYDYDPELNTVTWSIGTLGADSNGAFTLRVKVKSTAPQGQTITNFAELTGDNLSLQEIEQTGICSIGTVYVKKSAPEGGDGSIWMAAYRELRDALTAIRDGNHPYAEQIFVAAGTYKPTNDVSKTDANFAMIEGIDIYGNFAGWETDIGQRNLADGNYASILSGDIDDNNTADVKYVITAADARLDGFTVRKSTQRGISCSDCSPTIANCVVSNNNSKGISCTNNSIVTISNTFVNYNSYFGIYCNGANTVNIDHCTVGPNNINYGLSANNCTVNATDSIFSGSNYGIYANNTNLTVERCDINDNADFGIYGCVNTTASIQKCSIHNNYIGLAINYSEFEAISNIIANNDYHGVDIYSYNDNCRFTGNIIYGNETGIYNHDDYTEIRSNTIVYNDCGTYIERIGGEDNAPNIIGNIIWGNSSVNLIDNGGVIPTQVNYNCIGGYSGGTDNIINVDPCFADADANNFHLRSDSPCIDTGDPDFNDVNQVDIDGEFRLIDGDRNGIARIDMGADEYYNSPADFNDDGFVDFLDFSVFAGSWGASQGQAGFNEQCDFYNDDTIDHRDLAVFCEDWLWMAGWLMDDFERGFGGEGAYFEDNSSGNEMMMSMQDESMFETAGMEIAAENAIKSEPADIEKLVNWLDEVWLNDKEIRKSISEKDWQEFIESVKSSK